MVELSHFWLLGSVDGKEGGRGGGVVVVVTWREIISVMDG